MIEDVQDKIKNARLFAKKCLSDKLFNLNPNEYNILQISKFILLKERLIKKDDNDTIYFNYDLYHEYIDSIKEIGDTLVKNAVVLDIKHILNVVISPEEYNNNFELKYYILLIHKLRVILAHGDYEINNANEIIIRNDSNDIKLFSRIPIKLIEKFTFIKMPLRKSFYHKLEDKYDTKLTYVNRDKILNNDFKINNIDDNKKILFYNMKSDDDYYNNYDSKTKKDELEIFKALLLYADKIGLSHQKIDFIVSSVKESGISLGNNKPIMFDIKRIIDEIANITGLKSREMNPYAFASVYNYMQIYLSNKHKELWETRPEILSHLKLSKINPQYAKTNPQIYKEINILIKTIVNRTNKAIKKYQLVTNIEYKKRILDDINISFKKNINDILRLLSSRNMDIITCIRNGIDHGNILEDRDKIIIYDKDNQKDNKSINFVSIATCEDYYNLIETLELGVVTPLTNRELLVELKSIVEPNLLNQFELLIDEIELLNNERKY